MANRLKLESTLTCDGRQFFGTLDRAESRSQAFANKFSRVIGGAFAIAKIQEFGRHMLDTIGRWHDLSEQFATSGENIQLIEQAFVKAGLGGDKATSAMSRLSSAIDDALKKGETGPFDRLGISMQELAAMGNDVGAVMRRVAAEIDGLDRSTARDIARDLFGDKAGERFLAALAELRKGGGGEIVSEEDRKAIAGFKNQIEEIKQQSTAAAVNAAKSMSPWQFLNPNSAIAGLISNFVGRLGGPPAARLGRRLGLDMPTGDTARPPAPVEPRMMSPFNREEFDRWQQELKAQAELQEQIFKIQQKTLPISQQRVRLEAEINKQLRQAEDLQKRGDTGGANDARKRALDLTDSLVGLGRSEPWKPQLNEWQRVGAFAGDSDRMNQLGNQILQRVNLIIDELRRTQTVIRENGGGAFDN